MYTFWQDLRLHSIEMAEAEAPASTPRIVHDLERILYRIAYGFVFNYGVQESDDYLKQIANEIYVYLRQTGTYDPQGETNSPDVDKGLLYEHAPGTDEALDGHLEHTFNFPATDVQMAALFKCIQCDSRRFYHQQNLTRHLIWHSNPVVEKSPNDDDKLNFEATHTWLYQFKEKYLWPRDLYKNLIVGMPSPSGSSLTSVEDLPVLNLSPSSSTSSITMEDIQVVMLSPDSSTSSEGGL